MKRLAKLTSLLAVCFIFLLAACSGDITGQHIEKAIDLCSGNGGLKSITVVSSPNPGHELDKCTCFDGAEYPRKMILK